MIKMGVGFLCCAATLLLAPVAVASTSFGSTLAPDVVYGAPGNSVSSNLTAAGTSAAAPFDGVVTAFRVKHGTGAASPGAYAWRILTGTASPFVGRPATPSGQNDVFLAWPPSARPGVETWFPTDAQGHAVGVPIRAGERIALWTEKVAAGAEAPPFTASAAGSTMERSDIGDHVSGTQAYGSFSNIETLIQGTLEPDADGDRYGDETQDPCPAVAGLGPCPGPPPAPQLVVVTNVVTKTVACAIGTRPEGDHCARVVCPRGKRLKAGRCVSACPRGKRLVRGRCARRPRHRANRP